MKASFAAVLAALAPAALALPTPTSSALPSVIPSGLTSIPEITKTHKIGDLAKELNIKDLPTITNKGDMAKALKQAAPAAASTAPAVSSGHVVQDLGPHVGTILTILGPDAQVLLIELSPEVDALVSGLGLGVLGAPLGGIVASASGLGDLLVGLAPYVDGLVTVVGQDVGALLIGLSPEVAGLVSGLGLSNLGVPLGTVVGTLGTSLKKRGEIVHDLAPEVQNILITTGGNVKQLLIKISPEVAALVNGLGLFGAAEPLGSVVHTASEVGDLVKDVSGPAHDLLIVTEKDGQKILLQLSPEVAATVAGLGLPTVGTPLGSAVATLGHNL
ncbi:hypothetical protein NUU61_008001 [Penicillium alfredii]|uniref:Uncharacterized protein n=1 Tax=Penicillium alfredii TaxID=1506179 RepID=A0A9W9ERU8_9EURO|nr:uncharacterized protein NUU61_008001 [Penicillium alfredii]KAJ5086694.1 hypothetical protein NUU61_008001 [Penicillium alfredii]